jgi:hypothetical protein
VIKNKNGAHTMRRNWIGGSIFLAVFVIVVLGYIFLEDSLDWKAVGALASIFVIFWAVFQQTIISWLNKPVLKITKYKHNPPFFRQAPEEDKGIEVAKGYYANLELINKGKNIAYKVQPRLTGVWEFKHNRWHKDYNWIPVGLFWIFDPSYGRKDRKPIEEKNLVPWRPDRFNLLRLSTDIPFSFQMMMIYQPTAQQGIFSKGRYCFEVTVTAENSLPLRRYYEVDFHEGGINEDFASVKKKIDIIENRKPPK